MGGIAIQLTRGNLLAWTELMLGPNVTHEKRFKVENVRSLSFLSALLTKVADLKNIQWLESHDN